MEKRTRISSLSIESLGVWVAPSVQCLTLDLISGLGLVVLSSSPVLASAAPILSSSPAWNPLKKELRAQGILKRSQDRLQPNPYLHTSWWLWGMGPGVLELTPLGL